MDFMFWLDLVLFILLMGFSAFFSSSETALFSLSELQLEKMRQGDHPRIDLIEKLLASPRRLIMTILIGNDLVNIAASVISAAFVIQLLGADKIWVNLFFMVPILLLVGEIRALHYPDHRQGTFARKYHYRRYGAHPGP